MKFIADAMLGRLAKRMRLLGFDVSYDPAVADNDVIRLSLDEGRLILTRDTGLAARPLAKSHLLIQSDRTEEQLRQVLQSFSIAETPGALTRCSVCNEALATLDKRDARDRVPPFVYDRTESFLECRACGRVYWRGTHVPKMGIGREK